MKILLAFTLALTGCAGTVRGFQQDVRDARADLKPRSHYQRQVLLYSAVPGWGWIYECNDPKGPCDQAVSPGVAYFLATGAAAAVLASGVRRGDVGVMAAASAGLLTLRFNDVRWALHAAKRAEK